MAPRANWKGYLRLSLVSCPIALFPASSLSEKVSFNRLNKIGSIRCSGAMPGSPGNYGGSR
jgi:non-homologous end joining protein Ku